MSAAAREILTYNYKKSTFLVKFFNWSSELLQEACIRLSCFMLMLLITRNSNVHLIFWFTFQMFLNQIANKRCLVYNLVIRRLLHRMLQMQQNQIFNFTQNFCCIGPLHQIREFFTLESMNVFTKLAQRYYIFLLHLNKIYTPNCSGQSF